MGGLAGEDGEQMAGATVAPWRRRRRKNWMRPEVRMGWSQAGSDRRCGDRSQAPVWAKTVAQVSSCR